jgi:hypothetical protein
MPSNESIEAEHMKCVTPCEFEGRHRPHMYKRHPSEDGAPHQCPGVGHRPVETVELPEEE